MYYVNSTGNSRETGNFLWISREKKSSTACIPLDPDTVVGIPIDIYVRAMCPRWIVNLVDCLLWCRLFVVAVIVGKWRRRMSKLLLLLFIYRLQQCKQPLTLDMFLHVGHHTQRGGIYCSSSRSRR